MTPAAPPPMVDLRGAGKRYGAAVALRPTTLAFPRGRVAALLGPSGCGKSTLLRLVLGLLRPTEGEVRVDGAPLTPATLSAVRRRTGYVVQDGGLFPHMTARDNVTLLARHLRRDPAATARRVAELADLVRLPAAALDRFPAELSGGQRQRVGVMRALALDPPLLLMDEPMAALDPLVRADLRADLGRIFKALGKTVLLVTHDPHEAAALADDVVLLENGAVAQRGPLADLRAAPATPFVARFLAAFPGAAA